MKFLFDLFPIILFFIAFKLGDVPQESTRPQAQDELPTDPYANFPQGDLTPEQLMFYSSGGMPDDDPDNKELKQ